MVLIGILLIFSGFGVLGLQTYMGFFSGEWLSLSLIDTLILISSSIERGVYPWLLNPTEWIGLHEILSFMPLSGTLILLGFILASLDKD